MDPGRLTVLPDMLQLMNINSKREKKQMKKLMIMIAILIGFSATAQAMTKAQTCQMVEYMGVEVMKFKKAGGTLNQAISIMEPNLVGLKVSDQTYLTGVIAVAFESNMSPNSYGKAVYSNCLKHL